MRFNCARVFFICKITCPKNSQKGGSSFQTNQLLYKQKINFSILTFLAAVLLVTSSLKFFGLCNYKPFPDDFRRSEVSNNSFRHSRRDMLQRQFASYEMRKKVLLLKIQLVSPVDGEAGTKASIFDALANCPRYNREITMQYSLGVHQLAYCPQHVSCSYTS